MKAVCVFCGSSAGNHRSYADMAAILGAEIAGRGLTLVYGGATVGLMGVVADAAIAAGGAVIGVIPQALVDRELAHPVLASLNIVPSMHARKAMMADLADGFIALPGGVGTLEELFEVWTWGQLGHHEKPVGFLNVRGYYDQLAAFLDHQTLEGFLRQQHRDMIIVDVEPVSLLDRFARYEAPAEKKWIESGER